MFKYKFITPAGAVEIVEIKANSQSAADIKAQDYFNAKRRAYKSFTAIKISTPC